jgi:magnesium chelatase accessory protein
VSETDWQTIELDGWTARYLERGASRPGEPTLLLLHGLIGTAETYAPLLAELPVEMHVIALNLQGCGRREQQYVGSRQHDVAERVELFMAVRRLVRPILVGHSHGGTVALRLAAEHPEDLSGLVLLAPAHPFSHHATRIVRFWGTVPGFLLAHSLRVMPQWMLMTAMRRMAGPARPPTPELLAPYRSNLRDRGTVNYLRRLLATWREDMLELRDLLAVPLATPVLLIWGDHDTAVPAETAAALREHMVESELCVVHGSGHNTAEECPERCAEVILRWMGEHGWTNQAGGGSANSSASQERRAAFMRPSFESGD